MFVNLEAILNGKTRAIVVATVPTIEAAPAPAERAPDVAAPAPAKPKRNRNRATIAPVVAAPDAIELPEIEVHNMPALDAGSIAPDYLTD